jgi:hypothetical protein
MASTLSGHAASRNLMKLPLDERNQAVKGGLVALTPFEKQSGGLRKVIRNVAILRLFLSCTVLLVRSRFTGRRVVDAFHRWRLVPAL